MSADAISAPYQDRECLSCHSANIKSKKLSRTIEAISPDTFKSTPHEKKLCVDCHSTARLSNKPKKHMTAISAVDCGQCHFKGNKAGAPNLDIAKQYYNGIHGKPQKDGKRNPDTPKCTDCHGMHSIYRIKDARSSVNKLNEYKTCGKCHGDPKRMKKYKLSPDVVEKYDMSAHGQSLVKLGLNVTAVCSDCHGSHDIQPPKEKKSMMNRDRIPIVCSNCHQGIYIQYRESIHGAQWAKGNPDVPVCTDCHGEHDIKAPTDSSAKTSPVNVSKTCTKCHGNTKITRKYNVPINRLESYQKSFHGSAMELNNLNVANCASCHGAHEILPSSDPRSLVNKKNLPKTCGACHPDAKKNKNIGKVHVDPESSDNLVLYIVRTAYLLLILGSVGGFVFFIAVDIYGHRRRRKSSSAREDASDE